MVAACGPKMEPSTPRDIEEQNKVIEQKNKAVPYRNRAIDDINKGDWFAARKALQECVESLNDSDCVSELKDLESQHRF